MLKSIDKNQYDDLLYSVITNNKVPSLYPFQFYQIDSNETIHLFVIDFQGKIVKNGICGLKDIERYDNLKKTNINWESLTKLIMFENIDKYNKSI